MTCSFAAVPVRCGESASHLDRPWWYHPFQTWQCWHIHIFVAADRWQPVRPVRTLPSTQEHSCLLAWKVIRERWSVNMCTYLLTLKMAVLCLISMYGHFLPSPRPQNMQEEVVGKKKRLCMSTVYQVTVLSMIYVSGICPLRNTWVIPKNSLVSSFLTINYPRWERLPRIPRTSPISLLPIPMRWIQRLIILRLPWKD